MCIYMCVHMLLIQVCYSLKYSLKQDAVKLFYEYLYQVQTKQSMLLVLINVGAIEIGTTKIRAHWKIYLILNFEKI